MAKPRPTQRIDDTARDSDDLDLRQQWREQYLNDWLTRENLKLTGSPKDPRGPGFWGPEAVTTRDRFLRIGEPPAFYSFAEKAPAGATPMPEALAEQVQKLGGPDKMLGKAVVGHTEGLGMYMFVSPSHFDKVSTLERKASSDALKVMVTWGEGVLAQPEIREALEQAHSNEAFNMRLSADDPGVSERSRKAMSDAEMAMYSIYQDSSAARKTLEGLIETHGAVKAAEMVSEKPSVLGDIEGFGFGRFGNKAYKGAQSGIARMKTHLNTYVEAEKSAARIAKRAAAAGGERPVDRDLLQFELNVVRLGYSINKDSRLAKADAAIKQELQAEADQAQAILGAAAEVGIEPSAPATRTAPTPPGKKI